MLGFHGHFATKSRHYSITLTSLRQARVDHTRRQARELRRLPGNDDVDREPERVSQWTFAGIGYRHPGDAWLAEMSAAHARERRQLARAEMGLIRAEQRALLDEIGDQVLT